MSAPGKHDDDDIGEDPITATLSITPLGAEPIDAAPPSAPVHAGDVLGGRFSILRKIGDGGTGAVFAARDLLLGEDVALKLLYRAGLEDLEGLRRLRDEVRAARRIAHPNVCRVHDLAEVDGRVFVVMELLAGSTLRERMRRGVSVAEALEILRQLAAGLGAAHRAGVIHCDVKPENAILSGGRVVLTDFGIARVAGPELGDGESPVEGTPAYMSPEQLSGEPVDERTDVFALAVIASEMLLGAHPFAITSANTFVTLSRRVLSEEPRFPEDRPEDLDAEARGQLVRALRQGLARHPGSRFEDVGSLVAALAAAVGPLGASRAAAPAPADLLETARTPGHKEPRRATTTGARGVRRLMTIAHVIVDPTDEEDEERALERVEAMLDVAEASLVDAGGAVVARLARGVVAAFGAARAAGDEPQRAADASRAVVAAAASGDAHVRAGIDTGRLLARQTPAGGLTVAGDALARAAALAAAASPGEVRASDRAARHLVRRFLLEAAGPDAHRVLSRRPAADREARRAPLVGREAELARLVDGLAGAARLGRPRAALVLGAPGVGKSRLVREAIDALASRGFVTLSATASPDDALAPYAVLRSLLRELLGLGPRPDSDEAGQAARRALGREPDAVLAGALVALITGGEPLSGRTIGMPAAPVVAAARAALVAAAARRPLLLVLDDAHWADDATLDLVESIARGEIEAPIAVVCEARSELVERRPRSGDAYPVRLEIAPLPVEQARALAALCLGRAGSAEQARAVAEGAEGNPFYIEELARDVVERGVAPVVREATGPVDTPRPPTTVEEAIQARLDRLAPDARELLRAATVLGRSFRRADLAELVAAAGDAVSVDAGDLDRLLADLDERRVVSALPPDAAVDDRYAVRHALIRDVAYRELAPAARRKLHAAAARLIQTPGGDTGEREARDASAAQRLAELAWHLEGAEDRAGALAAYRRAGELAHAQGAPADALRCFTRARALAGAEPDPELLVAFGSSALEAGNYAESERALDEAIARGSARVAARACHVRSALAKQRAQWPDAVAFAWRGLALLEGIDDPVLAALLHGSLGWVQGYILGDTAQGLSECLRAVELLSATPHLAELGVVYSMLGAAYMRAGRWRDQLRCNRKNLEIGEKLGSLELQARAHLNLGVNLQSLGETAESIASSRTAIAIYEKMCVPAGVGLARNNLAIALVDLGEIEEAAREVAESLRLSELCGGLYYLFETQVTLARIAGRRGDFETAGRHAASGVELAAGSPIDQATGRRTLGALLSMDGAHDEAVLELARAAEVLGDADLGEAARIVAERGRAALRRGDRAAAEPLLAEARSRLAALGAALDLANLTNLAFV